MPGTQQRGSGVPYGNALLQRLQNLEGSVNTLNDFNGASLISPNFQGIPTAPTALSGTNSNQIATCGFVTDAVAVAGGFAPHSSAITSPGGILSGYPTWEYAGPGVSFAGGEKALVFVTGTIVPSGTGAYGAIGFEYSWPGGYIPATNTQCISFDANTASSSAGFSGIFAVSGLSDGNQTFYLGYTTIGASCVFEYCQITVVPMNF